MTRVAAISVLCVIVQSAVAAPTVYPTGTTIYEPARAWNGYTVFILPDEGAVVIDMNGRTVKHWDGFVGGAGGPVRVLPGGFALGPGPMRRPHQESNDIHQVDWNGDVVWSFERTEQVETPDGELVWSARQHHDWQRDDFPAGYYSPEARPAADGVRTLFLAHKNHINPDVSDQMLEDDRLVEVSWDGEITWEWLASDHVDELGFSGEAREVLRRSPNFSAARGSGDWLHINSATYLGPNRWYDDGDERFDPRNVILSSRQASIVAIVSRETGKIVWRLGPDYRATAAQRRIGQIIGQHHPHIIPKGLPGAGHILVFDNGGAAGYGFADPNVPSGVSAVGRHNSRVLEIDPVSLEVMWSYSIPGRDSYRFFSHYVSAAQRLENGNTMITEGADGRLFELTPEGEIVWEYVSPYFDENEPGLNMVYRAYRLPYDWIPQLERPRQRRVVPPELSEFRIEPE
jgi:hypothetical protein